MAGQVCRRRYGRPGMARQGRGCRNTERADALSFLPSSLPETRRSGFPRGRSASTRSPPGEPWRRPGSWRCSLTPTTGSPSGRTSSVRRSRIAGLGAELTTGIIGLEDGVEARIRRCGTGSRPGPRACRPRRPRRRANRRRGSAPTSASPRTDRRPPCRSAADSSPPASTSSDRCPGTGSGESAGGTGPAVSRQARRWPRRPPGPTAPTASGRPAEGRSARAAACRPTPDLPASLTRPNAGSREDPHPAPAAARYPPRSLVALRNGDGKGMPP